jgi:hypothetical protein
MAFRLSQGGAAMIYHFQVRTPTHVLLTQAGDFTSLDDARVEASRRSGELLREHADQLWVDQDWQMDVTDERGLILFSILIAAIQSAATSPSKTQGPKAR